MWQVMRDRYQGIAGGFYRYHPMTEEGIDVEQVRANRRPLGSNYIGPPYLEISVIITKPMASRIFVLCDMPVELSNLEYPLLPEQQRPADHAKGVAAKTHGLMRGEADSANSFVVEIPSDRPAPFPITLMVFGEGLGVAAIEWDRRP